MAFIIVVQAMVWLHVLRLSFCQLEADNQWTETVMSMQLLGMQQSWLHGYIAPMETACHVPLYA